MSETRKQLVEMGFSAGKIEAAIQNTDGSLEAAIEWLEALQTKQSDGSSQANWASDPSGAFSFEKEKRTAVNSETSGSKGDEASANTDADGNANTGGDSAAAEEEPRKELTPEEREKHLQDLRERAALRRAEKEKELAKEQRNNELIRKKNTQSSAQAMEDLKKKLAIKEAAKRRQEQMEDRQAKQRIKDLIEADKRARKAEREKANSSDPAAQGSASSATSASAAAKPASAASSRPAPTDTKIRVRNINDPPSGAKALSFSVETTLSLVAQKVVQELQLPYDSNSLVFVSSFPTKEYGVDQFGKSIKEAGLLSSSLVVKKA